MTLAYSLIAIVCFCVSVLSLMQVFDHRNTTRRLRALENWRHEIDAKLPGGVPR